MATDRRNHRSLTTLVMAAIVALAGSTSHASVPIEQAPLFIGSGVPGNLMLVPSVEFPTIISQANLGAFDANRVYAGYFDSLKCYNYRYSLAEPERHFFPVSTIAIGGSCPDPQWHGNYLNWAATQTIDPFRKALTGGLRVVDTPTETWVEKARHDRSSINYFPHRTITTAQAGPTTPFAGGVVSCVDNRGARMSISSAASCNSVNPGVDYDPAVHGSALVGPTAEPITYNVSMRVKVCDAAVGVESNCVRYSLGWKPEGLIQEYSQDIRYGVFGYLNDSAGLRDGGVLRARMKFVAPNEYLPGRDPTNNVVREWDATTGVLVRNPNPADAAATGGGVQDSGVINYINKFGQMSTATHKSFDPVSEMYYAALRYMRNAGNVASYSNITEVGAARYNIADGFPVISNWEDPMVVRDAGVDMPLYCAKNAFLGIGDVYTHRDKNLPGNAGGGADEPGVPAEVTADTWVNVSTAVAKIAELEGIAIPTPFTGRANSAYIAGLAYHAHTVDMRPEQSGLQTASTYWVDVRENQALEPRNRNQYWLAAKYGGFDVPENYDPYARTAALPNEWWNSGELLATAYPRPDNFYVASEAQQMIASLRRAFANISEEVGGSGASFAANTTRLEVGARAYQAQFFSGSWFGDLKAFTIDSATGRTSDFPVWTASNELSIALAGTGWQTRRVFVNNGTVAANTAPPPFLHTNLSGTQQGVLTNEMVNYLRGERTQENIQPSPPLRPRRGLLGDIVHSEPVFVGSPNPNLYRSAAFTGAASYAAFATAQATRSQRLYAGANDGMLHAFDASNGVESWAFVPKTAIGPGLRAFTLPDYQHRYNLDGEMTVADVYLAGAWKTILVGTMGRGTPGVFALDVTDPVNPRFLWEVNAANISALGNNIGKPIIAQVADGQWRVLLGNGPNGSGNTAQLIMLSVSNGSATVVNTNEGGSEGLSAIQAWDSNQDGLTDIAYAGDFEGNLWRFSTLGSTPVRNKLFSAESSAGVPQPISAAPIAARNPGTGETWVYFGTGRYLSEGDQTDVSANTWYGLRDLGAVITGRPQLAGRSILAEGTVGGRTVRVIQEGETDDFIIKKGWFIDLVSPVNGAEGERMVVPNRFQGLTLVGTTRIPDSTDVCNPSGRGFIMAIDPFTGGRLANNFFDVTGDGQVNTGDGLVVNGVLVPVSGVGFNSSPNNPIFVGSSMLVTFDDGSTDTLGTSQGNLGVRRASWREIIVP